MAITINCHKLRGSFSRAIHVDTNDAEHPRQILTCNGTILEGYKVNAKRINFGNVSRRATGTSKTIVLERGDGGPLSPKLLRPESENYVAEMKEITPGERYEVTVTLRPPYSTPQVRADLKFETGVADAPTGSVALYANVNPHVATNPVRIAVPGIPTPEWEGQVSLRWDDDKPHQITGASVDDPQMVVRVGEEGGSQRVYLRMAEGYAPPAGTRAVTIETDDKESPRVRVPVVVGSAPRSLRGEKARRIQQPPGGTRVTGEAGRND